MCCLGVYIDCVLINIFSFFSGVTYTDKFMFPLSACTCTADITHGFNSMEFFEVQGYVFIMEDFRLLVFVDNFGGF